MNFPSKLLEEAVNEFSKLPGVGKKTALRLVLHLLKQDKSQVERFGNSIVQLRNGAIYCKECHNLSDSFVCQICSSSVRDKSLLCVVEDMRDVIAIENTANYNGLYHVLGGIISPMEGIGPKDLTIDSLEERVKSGVVKEIILALPASMEGETTSFYVYRKLNAADLVVSIIARGLGVGDELEYADEVSLSRSLLQRTPFEKSFSVK
jgi:recombination protein RecR